jgi:EAL domain-containing protein (putative c-di-GMP-specific phosphodiesterase class I)
VDGVKIDREFTAGLGRDRRADAIVTAVLHMADALDLLVVVEGIETDDQVSRIVELRDRTGEVELHGQGFLFGRPEDGERRLLGFIAAPPSSSSVALG